MRLLNVETLEFAEFRNDDTRPKYAIASHRWLDAGEAAFQEVRSKSNVDSAGYRKVRDFARYVWENVPSVSWLWVDTCCINKDSAAELSEAINLMFKWYRNAEVCLAYLPDVERAGNMSIFAKSEWFERGWTLQELLAPKVVVFLTRAWKVIGNKGAVFHRYNGTPVKSGLERVIAERTGIPEPILHDYTASPRLTVDERLKWMEGRRTSRAEDMSYALYGLFDVSPGANYGEEFNGARRRLLDAIHQEVERAAKRAEQFRKIVSWLSPPDPWSNHETARQRHEAGTGAWFLGSHAYRSWKTGSIRHLWVYGKAGCGKTILCSTAIEDIRAHCGSQDNSHYATFYFSFSDISKQSLKGLVQSLVAQCAWNETAFSMLEGAYNRPGRQPLGIDDLRKVMLASSNAYEDLFVVIDALDECPEGNDARQDTMRYLIALANVAPSLRILVTSRDEPDIRQSMRNLGGHPFSIAEGSMSADIRKYVTTQLSRDYRLSRLSAAIKRQIEDTLSSKADGMFRWVYCQVQELKKLKFKKPSAIEQALHSLPATLDETYERMLFRLEPGDRVHASKLLQWLAYAERPSNLGELREAMIIDLDGEGSINAKDRAGLEDPLEILSGLVVVIEEEVDDSNARRKRARRRKTSTARWITLIESSEFDFWDGDDYENDRSESDEPPKPPPRRGSSRSHPLSRAVNQFTKVRLAHFSVKEYLESTRILHSAAQDFHLQAEVGHRLLAQSCLVYLSYYSGNDRKSSSRQDAETFPLLDYAAKKWYRHSAMQHTGDVTREVTLLSSANAVQDWISWHDPDVVEKNHNGPKLQSGSGLYYASLLGLDPVVQGLICAGMDVNLEGGVYGTALGVASSRRKEKAMQILLKAGADVDAHPMHVRSALSQASQTGGERIVQILLDAGANADALWNDCSDSALVAALDGGRERVASILLDAGADVNAHGGLHMSGSPLQVASLNGFGDTVQRLLKAGADVDGNDGTFASALQAASSGGHEQIVRTLLDAGAEVNVEGGKYGSALQAASSGGYDEIVQMLLDAGAEVNAQGAGYTSALGWAVKRGLGMRGLHMLLDTGADISMLSDYDMSVLKWRLGGIASERWAIAVSRSSAPRPTLRTNTTALGETDSEQTSAVEQGGSLRGGYRRDLKDSKLFSDWEEYD